MLDLHQRPWWNHITETKGDLSMSANSAYIPRYIDRALDLLLAA